MSIVERRAWVARRDRAKVRERDRLRAKTPERREHVRRVVKAWRARHPERARAHSAVAYALRVGRLVRQTCEVCGEAKVHAHHDDYSKPLDVRWLCPAHHGELRTIPF